MENYEKKYKEVLEKAKALYKASEPMSGCNVIIETLFPELKESEDEKIRKAIIEGLREMKSSFHTISSIKIDDAIAWLEKQELKSNPYSGVSFSYNGNVWGMCARDNGVDILFNKKLIEHISGEKQGEQKPQRMISAEAKEAMYDKPACAWSEEDEKFFKTALLHISKG